MRDRLLQTFSSRIARWRCTNERMRSHLRSHSNLRRHLHLKRQHLQSPLCSLSPPIIRYSPAEFIIYTVVVVGWAKTWWEIEREERGGRIRFLLVRRRWRSGAAILPVSEVPPPPTTMTTKRLLSRGQQKGMGPSYLPYTCLPECCYIWPFS